MAELLLKVGVGANYEDGDIVDAFSQLRIRYTNGGVICHPKLAGFNSDGLRPSASVAKSWLDETREFRISRLVGGTLERTTLANGDTESLLQSSDEVDAWVTERTKSSIHRVFGTTSREFWYDGDTNYNHTAMDLAWTAIESQTSELEVNHVLCRLGSKDKRVFLAIAVDDFTETQLRRMLIPKYDKTVAEFDTEYGSWRAGGKIGDSPVRLMLVKRTRWVDWQNDLGFNATRRGQVQDKNVTVDVREEQTYTRATIERVKP